MPNIATALEGAIDTLLTGYVTAKSAALITVITPVFFTGISLYVVLMGYAVMRGEAHDPLHMILWKVVKIMFVMVIALGVGQYQGYVIQMVQGVQEGMTTGIGGVTTIGQLIDNMAEPYNMLGMALWSKATTGFWPSWALLSAALLVAVVQFFLFAVGIGMYLLAKVGLALVLAVGPVFVALAMFPATQKWTESWIGQVFTLVLVNVFIAGCIAMLTDFVSQFAQSIYNNIDVVNVLRDCIGLSLASGGVAFVLLNVKELASALSGGATISGLGREIGRAMMYGMGRVGGTAERALGGQITPGARAGANPVLAANQNLYNSNVAESVRRAATGN